MELKGTNIEVIVRVRPLLPKEIKQGYINTRIEVNSPQKTITLQSHDLKHSKRFEFDEVFEEQVSQESFYAALKLNQLLGKVIEGFNATIFAYGPTGSGKTYTMEGYEYDKALKPIIIDNERVGLIPRITKNLFELLKTSDKTIEYTVYCTFIQIYKENVYDLLNPAHLKGPGLKLRWNKQEDFYLENLFMHPCYTYNEILSLYHTGLKNKFIASHNANSFSSRSHCILSLNIEGIDTETGTISTSKLQLVDLAGSEKVSQTGNEGMALKESIEINKALFTLRQVINNLALVKDGEAKYIPYRDSKLTSLLKQSIGGNSYCLMVACIAPMDYFFEDNLSTLSYAKKASCISNEPVKNTDPKTKLIKSLRNDIQELEKELQVANKQILILTEIVTLDPEQQAIKLKEVEKLPLKAENLMRIRTLRTSIESLPSTPSKHSVTQYSRFSDSEFNNFSLSPEILSEKLYDSVQMIRELMNSNKKLKENIAGLHKQRKSVEIENVQLQNDNQDLISKIETLQHLLEKNQEKNESKELLKVKKENERLNKIIENFEKDKKNHENHDRKNEFDWKTKNTVIQVHRNSQEKPRTFGSKDRNFKRITDEHLPRAQRPISQESFNDTVKTEAIATLSRILMKGYEY